MGPVLYRASSSRLHLWHNSVVFHEVTLKGHPTQIGALQGDILALWQVFVHHLLVGGFEVAVLADIGPLSTVLSHMLLHLVLGDGHVAVEGTLGVHILAVVLVRVQVSVQLLQCP